MITKHLARKRYRSPKMVFKDNSNYTTDTTGKLSPEFLNRAFIFIEFNKLKEQFLEETLYESNPDIIRENDNFKKLIALGKDVIPFMINDLFVNKVNWLEALAKILDIDPVKPANYGNMDAMIEDWENWYFNPSNRD